MAEVRQIPWSTVVELLDAGVPRRIPLDGRVPMALLIGGEGTSIGLLTQREPDAVIPSSLFSEIEISPVEIDSVQHLSIRTRNQRLFREFYSFLLGIADAIQRDGATPEYAVDSQLRAWKSLLRSASVLSPEAEVGLWGELWYLQARLTYRGVQDLNTWTGPLGEPHDFRFTARDVEVKTTRGRERIHIISDLSQLDPSPGKRLYIVSLQVQPGGQGGHSLPDIVEAIAEQLSSEPSLRDRFLGILETKYGYTVDHRTWYPTRYELRTVPAVIPVTDACPRLTKHVLQEALQDDLYQRIRSVQYTVDLSDLGLDAASTEAMSVLPRP